MLRFIYIAMLLNLVVLIGTAGLRFFIAFSQAISRLHLFSGLLLMLLILLHLFEKSKQLRKMTWSGSVGSRSLTWIITGGVCAGLWLAAWFGIPGISHVMGWSYEQQNRAAIFRAQDNVAHLDSPQLLRTTKLTSSGASLDLELLWKAHPSFDSKSAPQARAVAIWAETKSGSIIETLYLTGSLQYSDSHSWEGQNQRRGDILPVWRHRYTAVCGIDPAGAADLVSQPTINHQWLLDNQLNEAKEAFTLYVEVNLPGNDAPSLIYAANIEPSSNNPYTLLNLIGHSDGSKNDGELNYDLSQLKNAQPPVERILVKTSWGK